MNLHPYNLLDEKWLTVRRRSGRIENISPSEITDSVDPPIHFASVRPDFDSSLAQFCIGLIQTIFPPESREDWRKKLLSPPSRETLLEAFLPFRHAFNLLGEGPCFMQDLQLGRDKSEDSWSIERMLLNAPGGKTVEDNNDLFIKRDVSKALGLGTAAAALYTLQSSATSAGCKSRTSLRGGGPLSVIILGRTLWETIWLNTLTEGMPKPDMTRLELVFPWLSPCRISEKGNPDTLITDIHPLQTYWGTPRRVRLCPTEPGKCSMSDVEGTVSAFYNVGGLGVNYSGPFEHPLTPYGEPKKPTEAPNPLKGGTRSISFLGWPGIVMGTGGVRVSRNVHAFREEHRGDEMGGEPMKLWVSGFETDKAKVLRWAEVFTPIPNISTDIASSLADISQCYVEAAVEVEKALRFEVKNAISRRPADRKGDMSYISLRFQAPLEDIFYRSMTELCSATTAGDSTVDITERWLLALSDSARRTFDECAEVESATQEHTEFVIANLSRVAVARQKLAWKTSTKNKKLRAALNLPEKEDVS